MQIEPRAGIRANARMPASAEIVRATQVESIAQFRCFYHSIYPGVWIVRCVSAGKNGCVPKPGNGAGTRRTHMLRWTVIFLLVSLVAAVFGFGGIAAASAGVARILFFIFLVLFLASLLSGLIRRA